MNLFFNTANRCRLSLLAGLGCNTFRNVLSLIVTFQLAWLGLASSARGEVIHLAPVADTCFRSSAPNDAFGSGTPLLLGLAKEPFTITNRALLKFDLSEIPPNATILRATLSIVIALSNTDPAWYDLNRMLVNWDEYESTWNMRASGVPWETPGGGRGSEFVAEASVTAVLDETIFSSAGMAADVQMWLRNPGTNFGWMMIASHEPFGTGKQVGSRESSFGPMLEIEYTLMARATPPVLRDAALVNDQFRFSFDAEANRAYAVQCLTPTATGGWQTLTNISASTVSRTLHITNSMSSPDTLFQVRTQ